MNSKFKKYLINQDDYLEAALIAMNENKYKSLVVVSSQMEFVGCLTDGDIRRALVNGHTVKSPVIDVCNRSGKTHEISGGSLKYDEFMKKNSIDFLPIISEKKVVDITFLNKSCLTLNRENPVVIMAGGLGSRLGDLTKSCPKPMLEIGGKPILEHILLDLKRSGFKKIYLTVNYLSEVIESYFQDGSAIGLDIEYVKETKRLGTAGSLFFLKDKITTPFILMNADIYSKTDFAGLIEFHKKNNPYITVCTRNYQNQIPFGVLETENGLVVSLQEKPVINYEIGAGIYSLSAELLSTINTEEFLDMPEVINKAIIEKKQVRTLSLSNTWHDIGQVADYEKVQEIHGQDS